MQVVCDGRIIGCNQRSGQNGDYYLISLVVDGEAYQLMANKDIYQVAKQLEFGEEKKVHLDLRRYGQDWGVRVTDLEDY